MKKFDRYLKEGFDSLCDFQTYLYYRQLRRKSKIKKVINKLMFWKWDLFQYKH